MFQMGYHTSIKSSRKENSERSDRKLREKSKVLNWKDLTFPINLIDINKLKIYNSSISVALYLVTKTNWFILIE